MDSEKPINLFEMKQKDTLSEYLLNDYFVYQFVNNFSELLLLCKINVLDFFDMNDFFNFYYIAKY